MTFLEKLDYLMEEQSINKSKLSKISGVPYTTIDGFYKKGYENTKLSTIRKISEALNVTLDYLIDEAPESKLPEAKKAPSLPDEAKKVAERYTKLDIYGKAVVQAVMGEEEARIEAQKKEWEMLEFPLNKPEPKIIPLYFTPAAAGAASPIFGDEYDNYELTDEDPQGAVFAIKVSGDSMEPYFPDGSIVFCNHDEMADGDIGVFFLDGDSFIKQYHRDRVMGMTYLFSLNRDRADADKLIPSTTGQTLVCFGRVITRRRYPLPGM